MNQLRGVQPKTFSYRTSAEWLGKRNARFSAPAKDPLFISNPPEFRGEAGHWTPEELFIGSVETCLLVSFAALVEKHDLPVDGYYSEAIGTLESDGEGYRFTKVTIKPTILINDARASDRVLEMIRRAEIDCLVGNSQKALVVVEPDIVLAAGE